MLNQLRNFLLFLPSLSCSIKNVNLFITSFAVAIQRKQNFFFISFIIIFFLFPPSTLLFPLTEIKEAILLFMSGVLKGFLRIFFYSGWVKINLHPLNIHKFISHQNQKYSFPLPYPLSLFFCVGTSAKHIFMENHNPSIMAL